MKLTINKEVTTLQDWRKGRIKEDQILRYLDGRKDFIDDEWILKKLKENHNPEARTIDDILQKAQAIKTLTLDEVSSLLNVKDQDTWEKMKIAAFNIKKKVYDNRIVTFAPLYLSNFCVNDCIYCGFRSSNHLTARKKLTLSEVEEEVKVLAGEIGHKRLIVVYGEHPDSDLNYMLNTIKKIYEVRVKTKNSFGQIRRVNVNASPLSIEELKELKTAGLGTYQVFQETYHRKAYQRLHPQQTIKGNYQWRLYSMHRALEAGIDDVGLGALFGLSDWRFEVMGLVAHARELENKFGIGPHTISFPRLEPAQNTPFSENSKHKVSDDDFKKLITVIRIAVPYAGMIITARETPGMRRDALSLGITQTDASAKIGIGAYGEGNIEQKGHLQQFFLGDTRSLDEVIREFCQLGYITSFCTAGYRCGRTGERIMELLRSGQEGKFCKLNAVLTFREWIDDFASAPTKEVAEKVISCEIEEIKKTMPATRPQFSKYYERIKRGERDLYF